MDDIKNIAIIGSGNIGRSFALLSANSGFSVSIYDSNPKQLEDALNNIKHQISEKKNSKEILKNIHLADSLENCLKGAHFIMECVIENVEIKRSLFEKIDPLAKDAVILASSTSCIPPAQFTNELIHKNKVIGIHPFNPPNYIRAVEVVPSPNTLPQVVQTTCALLKKIGQIPIVVNTEVYGFAFVRIQYAIINECWRLVQDGVLSVEDVDTMVSEGLGMIYACVGPFEALHLTEEVNGFKDFCDQNSSKFAEICDSFGGPVKFEGPIVETVHEQLCNKFPVEELSRHKLWRDKRLAALSELKKGKNWK